MTCTVLVSVVFSLSSPHSFSSVSVFPFFFIIVALARFIPSLPNLLFLPSGGLSYLSHFQNFIVILPPLTLNHSPFLHSSMSSFFPEPFSFTCLLFLVPFLKLFSAKSSLPRGPPEAGRAACFYYTTDISINVCLFVCLSVCLFVCSSAQMKRAALFCD